MKRRDFVFLCIVTLTVSLNGTGRALTWIDSYSAGNLYMSMWGIRSHSWTFNILDDGFLPGFHQVTDASVQLSFQDDGWDFFEIARLNLGSNTFFWEVDNGSQVFTIEALMFLNTTGRVSVTLDAVWGDFYFNGAQLVATGDQIDGAGNGAPPAVPEPATFLLFSCGAFGAYFTRRIARNKWAI